jgi:hypothetical protein
LGQLTWLLKLDLGKCSSLAELPIFMGGMHFLDKLNLSLC